MSDFNLKITGMSCEHCVRAATKALEGVPGVQSAEVTLTPGGAVVHGEADVAALIAAVQEEGYEAEVQS
ncbi:MAG: cation transporter [Acidihalobacter sp.]|uniref:CopZ family metallochaperone n=1 Tax=Acidihalobacter sp. TaxID=1872108 RepID=UPI00307F0D05